MGGDYLLGSKDVRCVRHQYLKERHESAAHSSCGEIEVILTEQRVQILNRVKKSRGYVKVNNKNKEGEQGVKVELAIPLELV